MAIGKIIGRIAIKVLPDTTEFREKTASDLRRVEKQLGNLEVDVIPEIDKRVKEELKAKLKEMARDLGTTIKLDLDLKNGAVLATAADLKALTRQRKVMIAPELKNGAVAKVAAGLAAMSGLRSLREMARDFRKELMNLDRAVPKIGVVSHAIAGLGAWVLGVSGNLFSLSSSLATIAKAGLVLPGLFGGIAIGLATTVAALMDFNKQVPQASQYVKQLQNTISQNFWERAATPIRELVNTLFPILNRSLVATSTALGTFFGNFAKSATNLLLPALPGMFDALTRSVQIASGFTDAFVGIIEKLGSLGAAYLPSLAGWIGDIATQFDNWLSSADITGMVDEGITSLQQLGSVTISLFDIFRALGEAAKNAGGSTLQSLSEGLYGIARAAESPGFQQGLTGTLRAAYDLMGQIATIAGPNVEKFIVTMSKRFQELGPTIGDTIGTAISAITGALSSPAVTQGLAAIFQGFNDMVHTLAPAMDPLAEKFAALGKLIGVVATNLGVVLAAAITSLAPIFAKVAEAFVPVINMLGPILADVIKKLGPVFESIGTQLARAASALKPFFAALSGFVDAPLVIPILKMIVSLLGDSLVGVIKGATMVLNGLTRVLSGVVGVFKGFWDVLAGLFTLDFGRVWDGLKQVFSGIGDILLGALEAGLGAVWAWMNGTVLGFFRGFFAKLVGKEMAGKLGAIFDPLAGAVSKVVGFLGRALASFGPVFRVASDGVTELTSGFSGFVRFITDSLAPLTEVFRVAFEVIKVIVSTAWAVISTIFQAAFSFIRVVVSTELTAIRAILGDTWGAISAATKAVWSAISKVIKAAWEAIQVVVKTYINLVKTVVTSAWNAIKSVTSSVWNGIKSLLSGAWNAIKSLVSGAANGVRNTVSGAWNTVKSATSSAWNTVKSIVSTAWSNIKSSVSSGLGKVVDLVKSLPGKAKNALVGIGSILINSGKSLIDGFISGIRDGFDKAYGAVKDGLGKIRNLFPFSPAKDGPFSGRGWVLYSGRSVMDAMAQGIKDRTSSLVNSLSSSLADVQSVASSGAQAIADTISSALDSSLTTQIGAAITADASIQGVNFDRRLGGLERQITTASRAAAVSSAKADEKATITIGNITIPLEDLKQLKDLEEFLDMLRVRIQQQG